MTLMYIFLLLFSIASTSAWDYTFERVDNMNDTGPIIFDFRVTRVNRTIFALSGNVTLRSEITKNPDLFYHSTYFYLSSLGNNQYNQLPIRFPRMTFCQYINTTHRKYFMESMKSPVSDLPYSNDPNEDLCNGYRSDHELVFTIQNFMIDKSVVPPYVPNGMMRVESIIDLDGTVVSGVSFYIRTENESAF